MCQKFVMALSQSLSLPLSVTFSHTLFSLHLSLSRHAVGKEKKLIFIFFRAFLLLLGSRKILILICYAQRIRAQRQKKKRQPTRGSNNNCQVINVKCQTDALSRALFLPLCACVCTTVCVSVFGFARFCFCPSLYLIYYLGVCIK